MCESTLVGLWTFLYSVSSDSVTNTVLLHRKLLESNIIQGKGGRGDNWAYGKGLASFRAYMGFMGY